MAEGGGDDHELVEIEAVNGRGRRARCACGWTSPVAVSAHAAGVLWDQHAAAGGA